MQLQKAQSLLPFVGVLARNDLGQIYKVYTPAMTRRVAGKIGAPRHCEVSIERQGNTLTLDCWHYASDADEGQRCPALDGRTVCYHCLAALLAVASENNVKATFVSKEPAPVPGQRCLAIHAGNTETYMVIATRGRQGHAKGTKDRRPIKPACSR